VAKRRDPKASCEYHSAFRGAKARARTRRDGVTSQCSAAE
jgi:hypothetical protein